jgi:hypothetical protein
MGAVAFSKPSRFLSKPEELKNTYSLASSRIFNTDETAATRNQSKRRCSLSGARSVELTTGEGRQFNTNVVELTTGEGRQFNTNVLYECYWAIFPLFFVFLEKKRHVKWPP